MPATKRSAEKTGGKTLKKKKDTSPVKSIKKGGNVIDVYETLADDIVILVASKPKKNEAAYINPFKTIFNDDDAGEEYQELFPIVGFFDRKNPDAYGIYGTDVTMKQKPSDPKCRYTWECMVSILDGDVTTSEVGKKLAKEFTKFSATEASGMNKDHFRFGRVKGRDLKPLNHYLLDQDCVLLLRKMHAESDLDDVLKADDTLAYYFGTAEKGRDVLNGFDDDDFEALLG